MSEHKMKKMFKRDVKNHELVIKLDEMDHKHFICAVPGSSAYRFEIITVPGCLCYTGDMGDYTFRRTRNMLDFFEMSAHEGKPNFEYWESKCEAGNILEYSPAAYRESVLSLMDFMDMNTQEREHVQAEMLEQIPEGIYEAVARASELCYHGKQAFCDFDLENDFMGYTGKYKWCCYAILWAIEQYRETKEDQGIV